MPCFMSSNLLPSLRCRALVKIGVLLWENNEDALSLADFCFTAENCPGKHKEWQRIERRILSKTKVLLFLPTQLHQKLKCFIRIIGMEVMKWKENQYSKFTNNRKFLRACISNICWTPYGTVDVSKTSRAIVQDQSVDVCSRYEVACVNCDESDVLLMWEALPSADKVFYTQSNLPLDIIDIRILIDYWTRFVIKREFQEPEAKAKENGLQFSIAVETGNKVAVEYFWEKMSDESRSINFPFAMQECVYRAMGDILDKKCCFRSYGSDIACYLLSRNPTEILTDPFNNRLILFPLPCLLDWPHQSSFSEFFTRPDWVTITSAEFCFLSEYLIHKIDYGYRDCEYSKVFRELWNNCPLAYRLHFVGRNTLKSLLQPFLEDCETLSLVFKHVAPFSRVKLFFTKAGRKMCFSLAKNKNWNALSILLQLGLEVPKNITVVRDEIFATRRRTRASYKKGFRNDIVANLYKFLSSLAHNMRRHGINLNYRFV